MKRTERVAIISAVSYAGLTGYLVITAVLTQSRGVWAGALLVGLRLITSLLLITGLRLSERHSDTFPHGLYKLQNLLATLIGSIIIVLAYELIKGHLWDLSVGIKAPHGGMAAFASLLVAAAVSGFFAWYKARVGRQESSPALTAAGRHSLADFLAFTGVVIGVLLADAGFQHVYTVVTAIVGLYMLWVGARVVLAGLRVLLDASVEKPVLERVRKVAQSHPLVDGVIDVRGRSSGNFSFIDLSIVVVTNDLREARRVAGDLERAIHEELKNVDRVRVEFEVALKGRLRCAVPAADIGGGVALEFEDASSVELVEIDVKGGAVVSRESLVDLPVSGSSGRGVRLAVALARRGVEVLLLRETPADDDVAGTLDAYDVTVLARAGAGTPALAEVELLTYADSLKAAGDGASDTGGVR